MWSLSLEVGGVAILADFKSSESKQVEESVHDTDIHIHATVSVIN
jgi:hypothetical protein